MYVATRFEWDESKNRTNRAKHGFGFDIAIEVFEDTNAITRLDRDVEGESRWQTIGCLSGGIVIALVAHTYETTRDDLFIRIISARRATPQERSFYEEGDWDE